MIKQGLKTFEGLIVWCHKEFRESAENFMRDFRSLRALWNWIYLALYIFLCIWAALFYPQALATAIVTTGTIVGAIFTVYVASRTYEKVVKMKNGFKKPVKPRSPEDEGSA